MYKIYINEVKCILISSSEYLKLPSIKASETLVGAYTGKVKHLLNYIDMCEKNPKFETVIIHYKDFDILKKDFISLYKIQEAAGGLVENENGEYLFIFRRGFWDLPKGKIEAKESEEEAAIREVEEETGITNITVSNKLISTLHTFKSKSGNRIIKYSHWYLMKTNSQDLTPQKEEDIEQALWLKINEFAENYFPVYKNIREVLDSHAI